MKTEIVDLFSLPRREQQDAIEKAAAVIRRGGLVVFPTETVYGLGGAATDPSAAEKIYAAKGRPADNPLIIHVAEPEDAETYALTSPLYYALASAFMPGPLTVILPVKETIPKTVTAGLPTVAVRCPVNPIAHALLEASGIPIAAPSANLSGSPSTTTAKDAVADMQGRVDMILCGGDSELGLESTIVKIDEDGGLTVLRPGVITQKDLAAVASPVRVADAVLSGLKDGETPLSPGMKYKHYAPRTPFFLLNGTKEKVKQYLAELPRSAAAFTYAEDLADFSQATAATLIPIGKKEEPKTLARNLFRLLRESDEEGYSALYAPLPSQDGIGLALLNRMVRAAAHHIITL